MGVPAARLRRRSDARYPSVYVIQGYTGHVAMWANRTPFRQPFLETADAVFADGSAPPCIVVYVDAWTAYGGSQFVDSPGTGALPLVPVRRGRAVGGRALPDPRRRRASRAISGKSSGGFGAMITPMLRPDLFGALATHAGDTLYEHCYLPEFADAVRHLRDYDGDIWRWWDDFRSRPSFTKAEDESLLTLLGVLGLLLAGRRRHVRCCRSTRAPACCAPTSGQRWLDWDPVRMVDRYADALRGLRRDLDRRRDQRRLLPRPRRAGVPRRARADRRTGRPGVLRAVRRRPTPAIDYRYPLSLAWLAQRLAR